MIKKLYLLALLGIMAGFTSPPKKSKLQAKVEALAEQVEAKTIEWRHHLHQNPELSNREFKTAEYIAAHLKSLGLEVQTNVAKTGVVAILKGGKPGPVVALRADIDGLPVLERVESPWKSTAIGEYNGNKVPVMHACGHDTHIAILMGAAEVLTKVKSELKGTVKFIFQPAEEGAPKGEEGGAKLMVKEGVLKNPDVEAIFGLHIASGTHVGQINYKPGGIMASSNSFEIIIHGKQAHGSRPWSSIDPIVTAAQIINNAQTIVSRNMPLTKEAAVVTFGSVHGGVRSNIIPEEVKLVGTIRALDNDMRDKIFERLKTIAIKTGESNGATVDINIHEGYPITFNDVDLTAKMLPTLQSVVGTDNVKLVPAVTGAEDFSFFQREVPGFYFFLGGTPVNVKPKDAPSHHTPDFYVEDDALVIGIKAMSRLVVDYSM
ncbi:N-acyl-L-amino acid amidohydrolase [hydrothermal vent metagenome]|uniref:N-acyl-L-amino acid amidohydrolase n=1 Tax=hydrothermal vent metagenome TaxID=652676 RepID=A0A3B0U570_9ZZZZ